MSMSPKGEGGKREGKQGPKFERLKNRLRDLSLVGGSTNMDGAE